MCHELVDLIAVTAMVLSNYENKEVGDCMVLVSSLSLVQSIRNQMGYTRPTYAMDS